jgi:hypothetical protein
MRSGWPSGISSGSTSAALDRLPERFLGIEIERVKAVAGLLFHRPKPSLELHIGVAKRSLGVDVEMARPVHDREQQVANLFGPLGG